VDGAQKPFRTLMVLAPTEWRGFAGLARVLSSRGQHAEAAHLLERAVQLDPGAKPAYQQLGLVYRALGRDAQASRAFALGQDGADPGMPDAWSRTVPAHRKRLNDQVRMALALQERGDSAEAIRIMEEAAAWHPDDPDAIGNLGLVYHRAGRAGDARTHVVRALAIDETRFRDHITLAACLVNLGLAEDALVHADRAVELAPDFVGGHQSRARVLHALERYEEAVGALLDAIDADPRSALIRMQLGDLLRTTGRRDEAQERYREAADLDPTLPGLLEKIDPGGG
jgi:tetratricopeptide (TPR) repeat protein